MTECLIDKDFQPMVLFYQAFLKKVSETKKTANFSVVIERLNGYNELFSLKVFDDNPATDDANAFFCERFIKSLLWIVGGYKLYIHAPKKLFQRLANIFHDDGLRAFDTMFMERVYGKTFEVIYVEHSTDLPPHKPEHIKVSGSLKGARIGFDAGGSDRKVAAVLDGEVLYSEEVIWHPKLNSDPKYHYDNIKDALLTAKSKLPRVDALGISSAGIYIDNEVKVASLFIKVPEDLFEKHVRTMYIDIASELGLTPTVCNDGDVAALAGGIELNQTNLLGIAMGTSEAAGYIDVSGSLKGWLNELAFVPVDVNLHAMEDEWSKDFGVGVKYHSQDGIIKLATLAGIPLDESSSPAEKLKEVQNRVERNDPLAHNVFHDAGVYFAYSLLFYQLIYGMNDVLLMGRVASGIGGEILVQTANDILAKHHANITIHLPDEKSRRVGQAVAAASL